MREFNEKYLLLIVQEKKEDDFIKFRQRTVSVAEYETQFTKLSKFAPELIATEQRRVRRFMQGLDVEIQEALAAAQINTFTEVLEKVQRIEIARARGLFTQNGEVCLVEIKGWHIVIGTCHLLKSVMELEV